VWPCRSGCKPGRTQHLYKVIVNFFQNKLYRAREVCDAGGGQIGNAEFKEMRQAAEAANNVAARAYE